MSMETSQYFLNEAEFSRNFRANILSVLPVL